MKAKFWGYRGSPRGGEFVMLANWKGSSSCRRFDAKSGHLISYNSGSRQTYDVAYGSIYRECREVGAPPAARTEDMENGLPAVYLAYLQKQVGIVPTIAVVPGKTVENSKRAGMLAGTTELIESGLHLSYGLKTKSAALALCSGPPAGYDALALVEAIYARVENNWDYSRGRSTELWRWIPKPGISTVNESPEKTLEKAIVQETGEWVNQIPAASGLLADYEERHVNVDLGRRCGPDWFELVELKAGPNADTPLWAAFEILRYGLLYCFARLNRWHLNLPSAHELLAARRIDLKVLAPESVYAGYRLAWLGEALDRGLQEFSQRRFAPTLLMRFCFEVFPSEFRWPDADRARLRHMFTARQPCRFGN